MSGSSTGGPRDEASSKRRGLGDGEGVEEHCLLIVPSLAVNSAQLLPVASRAKEGDVEWIKWMAPNPPLSCISVGGLSSSASS